MLPAQCDIERLSKHIPKLVSSQKEIIWYLKSFFSTHLHGDAVLLVNVDDELHLVVGAEEDTAAVVDALGNDGEHACHVAVDCLAAGCGDKSQYIVPT